jgi:hypothetical protein
LILGNSCEKRRGVQGGLILEEYKCYFFQHCLDASAVAEFADWQYLPVQSEEKKEIVSASCANSE